MTPTDPTESKDERRKKFVEKNKIAEKQRARKEESRGWRHRKAELNDEVSEEDLEEWDKEE